MTGDAPANDNSAPGTEQKQPGTQQQRNYGSTIYKTLIPVGLVGAIAAPFVADQISENMVGCEGKKDWKRNRA